MAISVSTLGRIGVVAAGTIVLSAHLAEAQSKVTGGGQIDLIPGRVICGDGIEGPPPVVEEIVQSESASMPRATFGFNARLVVPGSVPGAGVGHLNYVDHSTGLHLSCTVTTIQRLDAIVSQFAGTCRSNMTVSPVSFQACVEDHGEPGIHRDEFQIVPGGGPAPIRAGNIQIHP